jgi:DNA-binding response OmpR family regulator
MTSVFVPDVVLLDLALPGLSGEVALERFGGLDATVPVTRLEIVLAASMAERHRRR